MPAVGAVEGDAERLEYADPPQQRHHEQHQAGGGAQRQTDVEAPADGGRAVLREPSPQIGDLLVEVLDEMLVRLDVVHPRIAQRVPEDPLHGDPRRDPGVALEGALRGAVQEL